MDDKNTIAEQQKRGLARLKAAIQDAPQVRHVPGQRTHSIPRRVAWARLWQPEDTVGTFAARHQMKVAVVLNRLNTHRAQLALWPARTHVPPYEIVAAYLASLPEHYLRSIES